MLYNFVLVSAIHQHESAVDIHMSPLEPASHLPLHSTPLGCHRAPHLSSLHHTVNPHYLSILHMDCVLHLGCVQANMIKKCSCFGFVPSQAVWSCLMWPVTPLCLAEHHGLAVRARPGQLTPTKCTLVFLSTLFWPWVDKIGL